MRRYRRACSWGRCGTLRARLVAAAVVTAVHDATGFSFSAGTGAQGSYRIGELPPGGYTVTVAKPGFRTAVARKVILEVNQKARLDVVMQVGVAHDSVTVTAEVSPLQNDDASAGYRLDNSAIESLPLPVRNVISLVTLGPGAIPRQLGGFVHDVVNDVQQGPRGAVALNPPINGSRSTINTFLLDGASDTDRNTFAIAVYPPMESVQEFRIQTSLPAAEFPQAGGGVVDVVTKSGGRQFHGSAFEYFRNEATDARNFFDDPALPRGIFRQNQFGGSLGGPAGLRDTYFFASYEGLRGNRPRRSRASCQTRTCAAATSAHSFRYSIRWPAGLPFPGNRIPVERIDPIARKFLDRYEPLPNRSDPSGNYLDTTPNRNVRTMPPFGWTTSSATRAGSLAATR